MPITIRALWSYLDEFYNATFYSFLFLKCNFLLEILPDFSKKKKDNKKLLIIK